MNVTVETGHFFRSTFQFLKFEINTRMKSKESELPQRVDLLFGLQNSAVTFIVKFSPRA